MSLYILQVVDGQSLSRVAAIGLLRYETFDCISTFFSIFKQFNEKFVEIETFMIDKDMAENQAVRSSFSFADIQLCSFHAMNAIKRKIDTLPYTANQKSECMKFAFRLSRAVSYEKFKSTLNDLKKNKQLYTFYVYMDTNWVGNDTYKYWTKFSRQKLYTAGDTTTNRNESINSKLKSFLSNRPRDETLLDLYRDVKTFYKYKENEVQFKQFNDIAKVSCFDDLKDDEINTVFVKYRQMSTDFFCKKIHTELKKLIDEIFIFNTVDNVHYKIDDNNRQFETTTSDCTCSVFKNESILCSHVFALRKHIGFELFEPDLVSERFNAKNAYSAFVKMPPVKLLKTAVEPDTSLANYKALKPILKQIGDRGSLLDSECVPMVIDALNEVIELIDSLEVKVHQNFIETEGDQIISSSQIKLPEVQTKANAKKKFRDFFKDKSSKQEEVVMLLLSKKFLPLKSTCRSVDSASSTTRKWTCINSLTHLKQVPNAQTTTIVRN